MPTFEQGIIQEARRIARLQREATKLRKRLKDIAGDLRLSKKTIRALMQCKAEGEPMPPLHVYGETPAGAPAARLAKVKS